MAGWGEEISLDVAVVSCSAPRLRLFWVEAKSNQDADILSATKYAV